MRIPFSPAERGLTRSRVRWDVEKARLTTAGHGMYLDGPEPPTRVELALAAVKRSNRPARGRLAGVLLGLDSVRYVHEPVRRRLLVPDGIVVASGVSCASALQTLVDLAATLDDDTWEHALESALRMELVTIAELEALLPELARGRVHGAGRVRRVLARRPSGAKPTGSVMETIAVQIAREVPGLADLARQHEVTNRYGEFVAFVDLCEPDRFGLFLELDGQQHQGQPLYDARRETAVVAATGWLCGRFTWHEVTRLRVSTARRLCELTEQARRRPLAKSA